MYSAVLIKEDVLAAKRLVKDKSPRLTRQLETRQQDFVWK